MGDRGDRKDSSLNATHQAIISKMQLLPANKICADCHAASPRWASTNLGCFLCIGCSGIHRCLGTHISTVRSTTLDTWTPNQITAFTSLGNAAAAALYEAHLPSSFARPTPADAPAMERFVRDKYERKLYVPTAAGGLGGDGETRRRQRAGGAERSPPARRRERRRDAAMAALEEMGFGHAAAREAMAASDGNLHGSVEWLLRHDPGARAPPPTRGATVVGLARRPAAPAVPVERPVEVRRVPAARPVEVGQAPAVNDLLSFGNDAQAAPKAAASAVDKVAAPPAWALGGGDDDDFADFGAFASALPPADAMDAHVALDTALGKVGAAAGGGGGAMPLAALYAQGGPRPAAATSVAAFPQQHVPSKSSASASPPAASSARQFPLAPSPAAAAGTAVAKPGLKEPAQPGVRAPIYMSEVMEGAGDAPSQSPLPGKQPPAATAEPEEAEDPFASLASFAMSASLKSRDAPPAGAAPAAPLVKSPLVAAATPAMVDEGYAELDSAGVAPSIAARSPSGATSGISLENLLG
jgi:stromal membrane-associated protein